MSSDFSQRILRRLKERDAGGAQVDLASPGNMSRLERLLEELNERRNWIPSLAVAPESERKSPPVQNAINALAAKIDKKVEAISEELEKLKDQHPHAVFLTGRDYEDLDCFGTLNTVFAEFPTFKAFVEAAKAAAQKFAQKEFAPHLQLFFKPDSYGPLNLSQTPQGKEITSVLEDLTKLNALCQCGSAALKWKVKITQDWNNGNFKGAVIS